jgi:thiamine monophosphate kinase
MGWSTQRIDLDPQGEWNDGLAVDLQQLQASSGARILLWDQFPSEQLAQEILRETGLISVVWPVADSLGEEHRRYLEIQQQVMGRLEAALNGTADRP